jgi:ubiquinol-cytochrome c reductase cytochrome b subunit
MRKPLLALFRWLRRRLGLDALWQFAGGHRVPAEIAGRKGWMYVFGNATMAVLLLQILTGIALATVYIPSPEHAYASVVHLTEEVLLGGFLRAMHYFGASAMVLLVVAHASRVFLTAAYKYPREMSWISGVLLGVLTLAMAFTGQLLRWDDAGLYGANVAAFYAARVPLVGPWVSDFLLAGESVGGPTLTRFYALHVLVLPGLILALLGLHLFLVLHHGISEPPKAGEPVDPATYDAKYQALKKKGVAYFPFVAWREAVFGGLVLAAIVTLALVHGPKGPSSPPDPTLLETSPKPDWFVVWYYGLLFFKQRGLETVFMVYLPLAAVVLLLLVPLVAPRGERAPTRRPWAVAIVVAFLVVMGGLVYLGYRSPWTPELGTEPHDASSLGPVPDAALRGATVFHDQGCSYCHRAAGRGGRYGPDLTDVAARLSAEEIAVRTVYGFGDMPAYGARIDREELDAIVAFLEALRAREDRT